MNNHRFNAWLAAYKPLEQEILAPPHPKNVRGMSFTELSAYRYRVTLQKLMESIALRPGDRILDIGPYPGGWASLLHEYHDRRLKIDLMGIGLTPEFKEAPGSSQASFIDFDVDVANPICRNPGQEIPIQPSSYRVISLLEIIEHLYDPLPLLRKIGESLTPDGRLIITTDNPFWFGFSYQALFRKKSPWGPVQESHLFNKTDWRPHMRLYSRQDLTYMLESSGLTVINSTCFNDHFGLYALRKGKLKFRPGIKPLRSKLPSLLLPKRLWSNRILIIAARPSEGCT